MSKTKAGLKGLNEKQELFCQYYVSDDIKGVGVQAYIRAYNVDMTKKGAYDNAKKSASRLLADVDVCRRINELLEDQGLNPQFADKQLLFLMSQFADLSVKRQATADYNKLVGRIIDKSEVEHKGLSIVVGDATDPDYIKWKQDQAKKKKV